MNLNPVAIGAGIVVAVICFFLIYSYLKPKDEKENNNTAILYSTAPSLILGILTVYVYNKYSNLCSFLPGNYNSGLLQEDFYS